MEIANLLVFGRTDSTRNGSNKTRSAIISKNIFIEMFQNGKILVDLQRIQLYVNFQVYFKNFYKQYLRFVRLLSFHYSLLLLHI